MPTHLTNTAAETEALAKKLLPEILNKKVIQLSGNLGSGKTTFVKGLAKALGIEKIIKSPTYTYLQKYSIEAGSWKLEENAQASSFELPASLYHFDLYRLPESSSEPERTAASIGLTEAVEDPQGLILIEWPERLPLEIPSLRLHFEKLENSHQINIT
jgi:tRNA threonylcarbamoyladenosine biosynthesis protein TsaE